MDLGLDGKRAFVAASSKGLGKSVALRLAQEGARVALCGRHADAVAAAAADIESSTGQAPFQLTGDLTDPEAIDAMCAQLVAEMGGADILINNAGGPAPGRFDDLDDEQWQHAFELNLLSAVRLTRHFLPGMRRERWGRIVNITSYSIKQPIDQLLLSNSVRLGVAGWSKTLSNEVASDGVLVNCVCPGWTQTDRVTQLLQARADASGRDLDSVRNEILDDIPMGRMGTTDEFADVVAFLASARAGYVTGTAIAVDGGIVQAPL